MGQAVNDRLYDVRPYLYAMGYWHDAMTNPVRVYTCLAEQGDEAIEAAYVRAGREFLRIERANGRGYDDILLLVKMS